jgi:hypothetical protein
VALLRRDDGKLEASIFAFPSWEDFDRLVHYLEDEHGATLERQVEGPDARKGWLTIDGAPVEIEFDDMAGTSVVAPKRSSESVVRNVFESLKDDLSKS